MLCLAAYAGGFKWRERKQELIFIKHLLRHYLVEFLLQPHEVALTFFWGSSANGDKLWDNVIQFCPVVWLKGSHICIALSVNSTQRLLEDKTPPGNVQCRTRSDLLLRITLPVSENPWIWNQDLWNLIPFPLYCTCPRKTPLPPPPPSSAMCDQTSLCKDQSSLCAGTVCPREGLLHRPQLLEGW